MVAKENGDGIGLREQERPWRGREPEGVVAGNKPELDPLGKWLWRTYRVLSLESRFDLLHRAEEMAQGERRWSGKARRASFPWKPPPRFTLENVLNATSEPARWDLFAQEIAPARRAESRAAARPLAGPLPPTRPRCWDLREWGGPEQAGIREFFAFYGSCLQALQDFATAWIVAGGCPERIPEEVKQRFDQVLQGLRPTVPARPGDFGPGRGGTLRLHGVAWELWRLQAGQADFTLYRCPGCRCFEVRP